MMDFRLIGLPKTLSKLRYTHQPDGRFSNKSGYRCETCGNSYDLAFDVGNGGKYFCVAHVQNMRCDWIRRFWESRYGR